MEVEGSTPKYLRGSDKSDPFTRTSIAERLPNIIRSVVERNEWILPEQASGIASIEAGIRGNGPVPELVHEKNSQFAKEFATTTHDNGSAQTSWLECRWWAIENLAYRAVLEVLDFEADPFVMHKRDALIHAIPSFIATALPLTERKPTATWGNCARAAILRSLWGNRADLSLSGGAVDASHFSHPGATKGEASKHDDGVEASGKATPLTEEGGMLRDDSAAMADFLQSRGGTIPVARTTAGPAPAAAPPGDSSSPGSVSGSAPPAAGGPSRVTIVLDNCGLELLCDLVLADTLLRPDSGAGSTIEADHSSEAAAASPVAEVELVAKTDPVFVSDATVADVEQHIRLLELLAGGGGTPGGGAESEASPAAATDGAGAAGGGGGHGGSSSSGLGASSETPPGPPSTERAWDIEELATRAEATVSAADRTRLGALDRARLCALAGRLRAAQAEGRLRVRDEPFCNSPLPMEGAAQSVFRNLFLGSAPAAAGGRVSAARPAPSRCLVLFKGDANYRRLLGDRHWPHDTPLSRAWGAYWAPAADAMRKEEGLGGVRVAVGALRTAKAGVLAGVPKARTEEAAGLRPGTWLVEGRFAVAQLLEL